MSPRRDRKLHPTYLPCMCGCGRVFHYRDGFDGYHGPDHQIVRRLVAEAEANSEPLRGPLRFFRRNRRLHPTFLPCSCGCGRLFHRREPFDGLHGPDHEVEKRLIATMEVVS